MAQQEIHLCNLTDYVHLPMNNKLKSRKLTQKKKKNENLQWDKDKYIEKKNTRY